MFQSIIFHTLWYSWAIRILEFFLSFASHHTGSDVINGHYALINNAFVQFDEVIHRRSFCAVRKVLLD